MQRDDLTDEERQLVHGYREACAQSSSASTIATVHVTLARATLRTPAQREAAALRIATAAQAAAMQLDIEVVLAAARLH